MSRLSEARDRFAASLPEFVTAFPFEGMVGLFALLTMFVVYFDEFGIYMVGGEALPGFTLYVWCALTLWGVFIMTMGACRNSYRMRIAGIRMIALMQIIRATLIWEGWSMTPPVMWVMFIFAIAVAVFCLVIAEHLSYVERRVQHILKHAEQE